MRIYVYTVPTGVKEDQVTKSTFTKPEMVLVVNERLNTRELSRTDATALDRNFVMELEAESANANATGVITGGYKLREVLRFATSNRSEM